MAELPEKENNIPESSDADQVGDDSEDLDGEALPDDGPERDDVPDGRASGGHFIDFDVWIATLEANFGQDFERVLQDELGPDWNQKINEMIASGEDFSTVVKGLKHRITGGGETEDQIDETNISFEAVSEGEVVGGSGEGATGGGGNAPGSGSPGLADLKRKEFLTQDKFKLETRPEDYKRQEVLRHKKDLGNEVVMIDSQEFAKLNWYAQKEKQRRAEEQDLEKILKRDSTERMRQYKPVHAVVAVLAGLLFGYAVLCVVSYIACGFWSRSLAKSTPSDYAFRPSSKLHRQGELIGFNSAGKIADNPVIFFTLRPARKKMDLINVAGGLDERFELEACDPSLILIPHGPDGVRLTVREHYRQFLPTNLGGFLHKPYLTLAEDEEVVLQAHETMYSSLLPGLLRFRISDGAGSKLGWAYVAGGRLYLTIDRLADYTEDELSRLQVRLTFLFSLLRI